eukprot:gene28106-31214_t
MPWVHDGLTWTMDPHVHVIESVKTGLMKPPPYVELTNSPFAFVSHQSATALAFKIINMNSITFRGNQAGCQATGSRRPHFSVQSVQAVSWSDATRQGPVPAPTAGRISSVPTVHQRVTPYVNYGAKPWGSRSRCVTLAASEPGPQEPGATGAGGEKAPDSGDIQMNVERAAGMINEMLEEIMHELFAENAAAFLGEEDVTAAAFLGEEDVTVSEQDAVRVTVISRIELLDSNFLAALNGFIQVAGQGSDEQLLNLLVLMRDEVLEQVGNRMPAVARVLNGALMLVDKDDRLDLLRTSLSGGKGEIPGSDVEGLLATTSQFINDMEEQTIVIDRRLLSRLCLVREEVRWLDLETSFSTSSTSEAAAFSRTNVPQRCAAFLKELTAVNESSTRVALLNRTFSEDWAGAAPRQAPQTPDRKDQPDFVRPGRFLETLFNMQQELKSQAEQGGKIGTTQQEGVLKRLGDIQMEAIAVLDRMQRSTA